MINVYVHCANKSDATSWYRAWGTFPDIEKRSDIRFHDMTKIFPKYEKDPKKSVFFWPEAERCDLAFFQRSCGGNLINFARTLKKEKGIPIWYDLDDNLWEIPEGYKIKKHFHHGILSEVKEFLNMADMITVSTRELALYINERFDKTCYVVNNGIDFDKYPINETSKTGLTLWRGSHTHADDIGKFRELYESFQEVLFMGYNPIINEPKLKVKGEFIPATDVGLYYQMIKDINPSYLLCFLSDNIFNRCKSNISYLEATLSGAISVNNQVGEFKGKGYDINNGLQLTLDQVDELRAEAVADCRQWYDLKGLNFKRINLIKKYAKL